MHGAKLSNQMLLEEKRVNRNSFGIKSEQNKQTGYIKTTAVDHPSNCR